MNITAMKMDEQVSPWYADSIFLGHTFSSGIVELHDNYPYFQGVFCDGLNEVHVFDYLAPSWWHCLGKWRRYRLAGGSR